MVSLEYNIQFFSFDNGRYARHTRSNEGVSEREIGLMQETMVPLMTTDIQDTQDQLREFQIENKIMKETIHELNNNVNLLETRKDAVVNNH